MAYRQFAGSAGVKIGQTLVWKLSNPGSRVCIHPRLAFSGNGMTGNAPRVSHSVKATSRNVQVPK